MCHVHEVKQSQGQNQDTDKSGDSEMLQGSFGSGQARVSPYSGVGADMVSVFCRVSPTPGVERASQEGVEGSYTPLSSPLPPGPSPTSSPISSSTTLPRSSKEMARKVLIVLMVVG